MEQQVEAKELEIKEGKISSIVTKTQIQSIIAVMAMAWGLAFLWKASFTSDPLTDLAEFITGFVTASLIGVVIGFYFGNKYREGGEK